MGCEATTRSVSTYCVSCDKCRAVLDTPVDDPTSLVGEGWFIKMKIALCPNCKTNYSCPHCGESVQAVVEVKNG